MGQTEFTYYMSEIDYRQITSEGFLSFYESISPSSRINLFNNDVLPSISSMVLRSNDTKPLLSQDIYPKSESKRTRTSDLFDVNEAL